MGQIKQLLRLLEQEQGKKVIKARTDISVAIIFKQPVSGNRIIG